MTESSRRDNDWTENVNGCTYQDFVDCGAPEFNGEGGALKFLDWIMDVEMAIDLSECTVSQKVEYATNMLSGWALVWWNEQFMEMGREAVARMTWGEFKALMESEFYPDDEKQRMEQELLSHKMMGTDHATYTNRFRELCRLVPHLVAPESKRIEMYIRGLNPQLQEMAAMTYPFTIQDVMTNVKRLADDMLESAHSRGNRSGHARGKKAYAGPYPECPRCNCHHPASILCTTCYLCKRLGHIAKDCHEETELEAPVRVENPSVNKRACYECGSQSHLRNACPRQKETPNGNQRNDYEHSQEWTYATGANGVQCEIPILARNDDYVDASANV
jgi:hypothetical protein